MEVRVDIDDNFVKSLQDSLKLKTSEIAKSAWTILNWAVDEASKGRVILSSDEKGENVHRLAMPALDAVQRIDPIASGTVDR